ncbi:MAG: class I SAM-dependent methyltransferase [Candidatus Omnitrophota bacterium]
MQKQNSKYYLDYLKRTDKFPQSVYHKAKHDMVHKMFDSLPFGSLVLDAGCGIGNITGRYSSAYSVVGIDEELSAIQYCHQYRGRKYMQASLYNIPFSDNTFNLIVFLDAIEHLDRPILALKELARVLNREGKILICTMNYASPLWYILENSWHRFFGGSCKPYSKDVHPTQYTAEILRQHCKGIFDEIDLQKRVMKMELFYVGKKIYY